MSLQALASISSVPFLVLATFCLGSDFWAMVAEDIFFVVAGLFHLGDVAAMGLGEGIAVSDVGLDVEDGGLVEEVDAFDVEDVVLDFEQANGAETDGVGAMGGAGG